MKRRTLAIISAALLIVSLLPATAFATDSEVGCTKDETSIVQYGLLVNGIEVTSANKDDVLGSADVGQSVVFTPAVGKIGDNNYRPATLTLTDATLNCMALDDMINTLARSAICAYGKSIADKANMVFPVIPLEELVIKLVGNNKIKAHYVYDEVSQATFWSPEERYLGTGISALGCALTIAGSGSLDIVADVAGIMQSDTTKGMNIGDSCRVNILATGNTNGYKYINGLMDGISALAVNISDSASVCSIGAKSGIMGELNINTTGSVMAVTTAEEIDGENTAINVSTSEDGLTINNGSKVYCSPTSWQKKDLTELSDMKDWTNYRAVLIKGSDSEEIDVDNVKLSLEKLNEECKTTIKPYGLVVNGINVNTANCNDVLGSADVGRSVVFTPSVGEKDSSDYRPATLTLTNAKLTPMDTFNIHNSTYSAAILAYGDSVRNYNDGYDLITVDDLVINLVGENKINGHLIRTMKEESGNTEVSKGNGIVAYGTDLTVAGNGCLDIVYDVSGIMQVGVSDSALNITGNCDVNVLALGERTADEEAYLDGIKAKDIGIIAQNVNIDTAGSVLAVSKHTLAITTGGVGGNTGSISIGGCANVTAVGALSAINADGGSVILNTSGSVQATADGDNKYTRTAINCKDLVVGSSTGKVVARTNYNSKEYGAISVYNKDNMDIANNLVISASSAYATPEKELKSVARENLSSSMNNKTIMISSNGIGFKETSELVDGNKLVVNVKDKTLGKFTFKSAGNGKWYLQNDKGYLSAKSGKVSYSNTPDSNSEWKYRNGKLVALTSKKLFIPSISWSSSFPYISFKGGSFGPTITYYCYLNKANDGEKLSFLPVSVDLYEMTDCKSHEMEYKDLGNGWHKGTCKNCDTSITERHLYCNTDDNRYTCVCGICSPNQIYSGFTVKISNHRIDKKNMFNKYNMADIQLVDKTGATVAADKVEYSLDNGSSWKESSVISSRNSLDRIFIRVTKGQNVYSFTYDPSLDLVLNDTTYLNMTAVE